MLILRGIAILVLKMKIYLEKKKKTDRLIVIDVASGLADRSNDLASLLTFASLLKV